MAFIMNTTLSDAQRMTGLPSARAVRRGKSMNPRQAPVPAPRTQRSVVEEVLRSVFISGVVQRTCRGIPVAQKP